MTSRPATRACCSIRHHEPISPGIGNQHHVAFLRLHRHPPSIAEHIAGFADRPDHVEHGIVRGVEAAEVVHAVPSVVQRRSHQRVHAGVEADASHALLLHHLGDALEQHPLRRPENFRVPRNDSGYATLISVSLSPRIDRTLVIGLYGIANHHDIEVRRCRAASNPASSPTPAQCRACRCAASARRPWFECRALRCHERIERALGIRTSERAAVTTLAWWPSPRPSRDAAKFRPEIWPAPQRPRRCRA